MVLTDEQLANMALGHIGVSKVLTSLADRSAEATAVNTYLPQVKLALLASHHWASATRRRALVPQTDLDDPILGWACAYDMPADCVTAIELWTGSRRPSHDQRIPFEPGVGFVLGEPVPLLLCDQEAAALVYISSALSPSAPPYQDALAWALAANLTMPLRVDAVVAKQTRVLAELYRQQAVAHDLNNRQLDPEPENIFLRARQ